MRESLHGGRRFSPPAGLFLPRQGVVPPVDSADTLGRIVEGFVDATSGWVETHRAAASFYAGRKEYEKLAREEAVLRSQIPQFLRPDMESNTLLPRQPASR